jgi:AbrB family looped-hinge helix DNA binding protein
MKATGIVRRVDDLGRIVLPKEIRKIFEIEEGDPIEIYVNEYGIVMKKYNTSVGLKELVGKLEREFLDVKDDIEVETADKIFGHIHALQEILGHLVYE